jgi:hypothetical protein
MRDANIVVDDSTITSHQTHPQKFMALDAKFGVLRQCTEWLSVESQDAGPLRGREIAPCCARHSRATAAGADGIPSVRGSVTNTCAN